jgi:hypothetical protein
MRSTSGPGGPSTRGVTATAGDVIDPPREFGSPMISEINAIYRRWCEGQADSCGDAPAA